ncbi:ABC transporter permease [uncultured Tateyamaria sp.]|uniref:ABC transporter permease n=1 Tax=Tateyamaria sp. 1078 TaxID=3417464 RepID=UPI002624452C|nr:ABC transporter permease [uncultured Tateyamaria sp.]
MRRAALHALLSHWRRHPLQLFAFLAGLALATGLWSGVQAINAEARASYDAAAATLGEGQFDQILPRAGDSIAQSDYVALRRAGWRVSPVIEGRYQDVRLLGLDPLSSPGRFDFGQVTARGNIGTFMGPGQLFATAETAARLDTDAQVIVSTDAAPNVAVGDIGVVQRLLGRSDLSRLMVLPEQPLGRPPLDQIAPHLRVQPSIQTADVGELTDSFHLNLTAFGLLSFAVGLFIVHSTIGLAFEQRRGLVRSLRALGIPLRQMIVLLAGEILLLASVGAALGIVLGYVVAAVLLPDVAVTLRGLYGAEVSGSLRFRSEWWASGLAIAIIGSAIAASGQLWQIAHMPILASARPRAWFMASQRSASWQAACAGLLALGALGLALFGQGLIASFTLLGCFLIAAALALPLLIRPITGWAETGARGPVSAWFWADTRQQLPGLSLALMALLLAVSANIGVSTMVSSFRLTFVAFLDQRLAAELYLRLDDPAQAEVIAPVLAAHTDEILPLLRADAQVAGLPTELLGVRVGRTYRDNWVFLDSTAEAWDAVAEGRAVITNEQFARRADLWVGDVVTLDVTALPIAAVVGDYGNPRGQVILGEALFQTLRPQALPQSFGLRSDDPARLRATLRAAGIPDSAMIDQAALKSFSLQVFERTFTVTAALNVLTLAVAGFAMLMSLLTLADQRLPQLAPVWALGLTRRQLGRLELARAGLFALLVSVIAVPVGLGLAWVLLAKVNVDAFGWRLPMFLFPGSYALLGLAAIGAAVLAALWPALRLMRTPPARLLQVFAHER